MRFLPTRCPCFGQPRGSQFLNNHQNPTMLSTSTAAANNSTSASVTLQPESVELVCRSDCGPLGMGADSDCGGAGDSSFGIFGRVGTSAGCMTSSAPRDNSANATAANLEPHRMNRFPEALKTRFLDSSMNWRAAVYTSQRRKHRPLRLR